mgnify:CR=1 FL=1
MGVASLVLGIIAIVLGLFTAGTLGWAGAIIGIALLLKRIIQEEWPQPVWFVLLLEQFYAYFFILLVLPWLVVWLP